MCNIRKCVVHIFVLEWQTIQCLLTNLVYMQCMLKRTGANFIMFIFHMPEAVADLGGALGAKAPTSKIY